MKKIILPFHVEDTASKFAARHGNPGSPAYEKAFNAHCTDYYNSTHAGRGQHGNNPGPVKQSNAIERHGEVVLEDEDYMRGFFDEDDASVLKTIRAKSENRAAVRSKINRAVSNMSVMLLHYLGVPESKQIEIKNLSPAYAYNLVELYVKFSIYGALVHGRGLQILRENFSHIFSEISRMSGLPAEKLGGPSRANPREATLTLFEYRQARQALRERMGDSPKRTATKPTQSTAQIEAQLKPKKR